MIVAVVLNPARCAARITSSQRAVPILSGQSTARTSSSSISAAVPGKRAEPGFLQLREELLDRHAQRGGALMHFKRRKGVNMHIRHRVAHGAANLQISARR